MNETKHKQQVAQMRNLLTKHTYMGVTEAHNKIPNNIKNETKVIKILKAIKYFTTKIIQYVQGKKKEQNNTKGK